MSIGISQEKTNFVNVLNRWEELCKKEWKEKLKTSFLPATYNRLLLDFLQARLNLNNAFKALGTQQTDALAASVKTLRTLLKIETLNDKDFDSIITLIETIRATYLFVTPIAQTKLAIAGELSLNATAQPIVASGSFTPVIQQSNPLMKHEESKTKQEAATGKQMYHSEFSKIKHHTLELDLLQLFELEMYLEAIECLMVRGIEQSIRDAALMTIIEKTAITNREIAYTALAFLPAEMIPKYYASIDPTVVQKMEYSPSVAMQSASKILALQIVKPAISKKSALTQKNFLDGLEVMRLKLAHLVDQLKDRPESEKVHFVKQVRLAVDAITAYKGSAYNSKHHIT